MTASPKHKQPSPRYLQREISFLTQDEVKRLLSVMTSKRDRAL